MLFKWWIPFPLLFLALCVDAATLLPQVLPEAYVKSSHTAAGDKFGVDVAVSGDTMVVGAYEEATTNTGVNSTPVRGSTAVGAAFVYVRQGQNWVQQAYLKPDQGLTVSFFGIAVAIDGDTIAVGASGTDGSRGAVYLFQRVSGVWQQTARLWLGSSLQFGDRFGSSVSLSGNTLAVGAPYRDGSGAVYVFERTGDDWLQKATLKNSSPTSWDLFGFAVSASSDTIVAGAPRDDSTIAGTGEGLQDSGAAFVFTRTLSGWSQTAVLKAANAEAGDRMGISVAISGGTIAAGAQFEASSSTGINSTPNNNLEWAGAVYVFKQNGSAWSQEAYVKPDTTRAQMLFGQSVALDGDTLAVGAPFSGHGTAYTFFRQSGVWSQISSMLPSNISTGDHFGEAVAVSGQYVAVGGFLEDSSSTGINSQADELAVNSGAAYIYRVTPAGPPGPEIEVINTNVGSSVSSGGTVDMGDLVVGRFKDLTLQVKNFGTTPLLLNGEGSTVSLSGSDRFQLLQSPAAEIAPGASSSLKLRCSAVTPGSLTAKLTIATNDSDESSFVFHVSVEAKSGPAIISHGGGAEATVEVIEGTAQVGVVQATFGGVSDSRLRYSLSGVDRNRFTIGATTGQLNFVGLPDFERPGDVDQDNVYDVTVAAALQTNLSLAGTQRLLVRVMDVPGTATVLSTSAPKLNLNNGQIEIIVTVANESREPLEGFAIEVIGMPARARLMNATHPSLPVVEVFETISRQSSSEVRLRFFYRGGDFLSFKPQLEVKAFGRMSLSSTAQEISAEGGSYPLELKTVGAWYVANRLPWVSTETIQGAGDGVITVTVQPNPSVNGRAGVISINGKEHRISQRGVEAVPVILGLPNILPAMVGSPLIYQFQVQNLPAKLLVQGLPPGLSLKGFQLQGMPTKAGVYSVAVVAENAKGRSQSTRFSIAVAPLPPSLTGAYVVGIPQGNQSQLGGILEYGGQMSLYVTTTGASSARLRAGAKSIILKGTVVPSLTGPAALSLAIPGTEWVIDMQLHPDEPQTAVTGEIRIPNGPGNWQQDLRVRGYRAVWTSAGSAPPIDLGKRRFYLRPDAFYGPEGYGIGTVLISRVGSVIMVARLADGTAMTCSTVLAPEFYETLLYQSLYRGYGVIDGYFDASRWLPDDSGQILMAWRKDSPSTIPPGQVEGAGWGSLIVSGEVTKAEPLSFQLPILGAEQVQDGAANGEFYAKWLHSVATQAVQLSAGLRVRASIPNDLQLSAIVQVDGNVSGSFLAEEEVSGRKFIRPFSGLVVSREGKSVVLGHYLHPLDGISGYASGLIEIRPDPAP